MASPFSDIPRGTVASWGEVRLIREIRSWLGEVSPRTPFGIGDDCAVLPGSRRAQLVTVDPVVHGRHFDDRVSAAAAGAKLLKRNLSDIAAMGGTPRSAVLALAMEGRTRVAWLRGFYRGLATEASRAGVVIVGGDVASLPSGLVASLTLLGEAAGRRVLTRTGARVGDHLFVTGALGGSRLGRHLSFEPRLAEGRWLASRPEVRALMDLSDGLAKDVFALVPSGARPDIEVGRLPVSAAARRMAAKTGRPAWVHALSDGEDYELLFAVDGRVAPERFVRAWRRRFGVALTCIGRFAGGEEPGTPGLVDWRGIQGYEHHR
jgi:thiamine-monophosphate kinase